MCRYLSSLGCVLSLFCLAADGAADPINGGFETGDFGGWTLSPIPEGIGDLLHDVRPLGFMLVVERGEINLGPVGFGLTLYKDMTPFGAVPLDGQYAAAVGAANARVRIISPYFEVDARQSVWVDAGQVVSGMSRFYNGDNLVQDSAFVRIVDGAGEVIATPWSEKSGFLGRGGGTVPYETVGPWTSWSWQAPESRLYSISLGASSAGDVEFPSIGFHDSIRVPEPSLLSLFLIGTGTIVARRRRRAYR